RSMTPCDPARARLRPGTARLPPGSARLPPRPARARLAGARALTESCRAIECTIGAGPPDPSLRIHPLDPHDRINGLQPPNFGSDFRYAIDEVISGCPASRVRRDSVGASRYGESVNCRYASGALRTLRLKVATPDRRLPTRS